MPRKDRDDSPTVRHSVDGPVPSGLPCVRVKIRIDHYPVSGELDFSLVAWSTPGAQLVANNLWASYDKWHAGMAATDLVAHLMTVLKLEPDPFPE